MMKTTVSWWRELFSMRVLGSCFLALSLFGYELVSGILGPFCGSNSALITTPYRAFMLLLAALLFSGGILRKNTAGESQDKRGLYFFLILYAVYVLKIMFDLLFDDPEKAGEFYWTTEKYLCFITVPGIAALWASYRYIDYELAVKLALGICLIGNIAALKNMELVYEADEVGRMHVGDGIELLNSISLGHFGVSAVLLGISQWKKEKMKLLFRLFLVLLIAIGLCVMIRAGSRGPLAALTGTVFFFIVAKCRRFWTGFAVCFVLLVIGICLREQIFQLVSQISPVLEERVETTLESGDVNRESLFEQGVEEFLQHPLGGGYFMVPCEIYSHNIILDAFMAFGIWAFAFVAMLVLAGIRAFRVVRENDPRYQWIALLFCQLAFARMFSGCFYNDFPFLAEIFILFTVDRAGKKECCPCAVC